MTDHVLNTPVVSCAAAGRERDFKTSLYNDVHTLPLDDPPSGAERLAHIFLSSLIALALVGLFGCHPSMTTASGPLPQRGYLWQRAWNPSVLAAVQEADKRMDGMVIIGAEILWNGSTPVTNRANIDWPTLKNAQKPIALALRVAPYPGPFSEDVPPRTTSPALSSL